MSMFKVNTMHFHLTEDQGWRIEIKKSPELTSIGGYRLQGDGSTYGGFYTQEEIKDSDVKFTIFTTRADTMFGVTFMVLAPESEYVQYLSLGTSLP